MSRLTRRAILGSASEQRGSFLVLKPGSGVFTVPAGVFFISVALSEGGGAGACNSNPTASSTPGGAGATRAWAMFAVTPGETFAWQVGAGGIRRVTTGDGADGGPSSFTSQSGDTRFIQIAGAGGGKVGGLAPVSGLPSLSNQLSPFGFSRGGDGGLGANDPGSGGGAGGWLNGSRGGDGATNAAGTGGSPGGGSGAAGGGGAGSGNYGTGGGGVGIWGLGPDGVGGGAFLGGKAGSWGTDGGDFGSGLGFGGRFGGGGGGGVDEGRAGSDGFLHIVWGPGRSFPDNVGADDVLGFQSGLLPGAVSYGRAGSASAYTLASALVLFGPDAPQMTDRGLLLEPSATNYLPMGEHPEDNAFWGHEDGAAFTGSVWNGVGLLVAQTAGLSAGRYTASVDLSPGAATTVRVTMYSLNGSGGLLRNGLAVLNLTDGSVLSAPDVDPSFTASVVNVAGGYRVHASGDALAGPVYLFINNTNGTLTPAHAQINAGGPTSYIPTDGVAGTRGQPTCTVLVPPGRTGWKTTHNGGLTATGTGLTPGATFDIYAALSSADRLGLGRELQRLEWLP